MVVFRVVLAVMFVAIVAYTGLVVSNEGAFFLPRFVADVARLGWAGQFNLDFFFLLVFASSWIAWRHHFSPAGLGLALLSVVGGTALLAPYLLVATVRAKGDMREVLLGQRRAAG